eukprot:GHVU01126047.1.p2 GENE.GHVU01126047.1~~GHVU01126047.1.p2  ORF type:complete len:100 (+),score=11.62 GHVU01126047.1:2173-2472(+)
MKELSPLQVNALGQLKQIKSEMKNTFTLALCDEFGNRVSLGGHSVSAHGSQGAFVEDVTDNGKLKKQIRPWLSGHYSEVAALGGISSGRQADRQLCARA